MIIINLHILSPIIYCIFVKILTWFNPIPNSIIMKNCRLYHNVFLSILSFVMLIGITIGNIQTGKIYDLNSLLCVPYYNNVWAYYSIMLFLYSKYLEWGDTLFLHLSGKPISQLQYTHHMSTAILVYSNVVDYLSPNIFIFMSLNCFVHIWMYWYFAFPKGCLFKYRQMITQSQIVQHIICLITIFYTYSLENCQQNLYGLDLGLFLYLMYLFYFVSFYFKTYFNTIRA